MSVILVDNAYFGHALRRAPRDGVGTYHPKPWRRVKHELRVTSNSTAVIAKEGETLKTLSYDCGNPGYNMSAGKRPQSFFIYRIATLRSR